MTAPQITTPGTPPDPLAPQPTFRATFYAYLQSLVAAFGQANTAFDWVNTTADAVDADAMATEAGRAEAVLKAGEAADSAVLAGEKVGLAADQVGLAAAEVTKAETARDLSQTYAAASGAAAGIPTLTGKAGKVLTVNDGEDGAEWLDLTALDLVGEVVAEADTVTLDLDTADVFEIELKKHPVVVNVTGSGPAYDKQLIVAASPEFGPFVPSDNLGEYFTEFLSIATGWQIICFNETGTHFLAAHQNGANIDIRRYPVSVNFDISEIASSFTSGSSYDLSGSIPESQFSYIHYVNGFLYLMNSSKQVRQYEFGTAFDPTTLSYVGQAPETIPTQINYQQTYAVTISADGTKLVVTGCHSGNSYRSYISSATMSTPFDVSTAGVFSAAVFVNTGNFYSRLLISPYGLTAIGFSNSPSPFYANVMHFGAAFDFSSQVREQKTFGYSFSYNAFFANNGRYLIMGTARTQARMWDLGGIPPLIAGDDTFIAPSVSFDGSSAGKHTFAISSVDGTNFIIG